MDDEIDLRDVFHFSRRVLGNGLHIIWKSRRLIISIFMIAVLVAGLISFAMTPVYKASCVIALGNYGDPIYTNDVLAKELLLSDEYLLGVIDTLNLDVPSTEFMKFKENIEITNITGSVFEISVETTDRQNATKIVIEMVSSFINHSETQYGKYNKLLSDKMVITEENLDVLDKDINQTRTVLRNIDKLPGTTTQEQLELSHSRTLENLQNAESKRASMLDQYIELKRQLDFMENARVLMRSEEPTEPIWPRKALIAAIGGILGLMIGIFEAFRREGLRRPNE